MITLTAPTADRGVQAGRQLRRNAWPLAVVLIFLALLAWQAALSPNFGAFELQTLFASTLGLAFLAVAQSVVVVGGGIDLSVGATMVLVNVVSARYMESTSFGGALLVAAGSIALAVLIGAVTGLVITLSGVPDVIVTLATSFVWAGVALVVMPIPGGGAPDEFLALIGTTGLSYWPALVALVVPLALIWIPLRRSRAGLAIYAMGSHAEAAYLSGVRMLRTRVLTYAVAGVFVGLAGLATTAWVSAGNAQESAGLAATLTSLAAAVLGGVAIGGGIGGILGPIVAVWILYLIPAIMLGLGVDPALGEALKGVVIVLVVLVGGLIRLKWSRS
jgi:ribose transport system permease protein